MVDACVTLVIYRQLKSCQRFKIFNKKQRKMKDFNEAASFQNFR